MTSVKQTHPRQGSRVHLCQSSWRDMVRARAFTRLWGLLVDFLRYIASRQLISSGLELYESYQSWMIALLFASLLACFPSNICKTRFLAHMSIKRRWMRWTTHWLASSASIFIYRCWRADCKRYVVCPTFTLEYLYFQETWHSQTTDCKKL